jgi:chromosome segregation ATPase
VTSEAEKSQGELANLSTTFDDSQEKIRSLEVTVDSAYKEIADLNKQLISKDQNKEASLKVEEARKELEKQLDEKVRSWELERDQLHGRIQDLQDAQMRVETNFNRREENLKFQVTDMQERLNDAEKRSHDLSQSIQSATRPLLRQIENLQATNSNQSATFDALEKNLQNRIDELQEQLVAQQESDRTIRDTIIEMRAQQKILDTQRSEALEIKNQLQNELKAKTDELDQLVNSDSDSRIQLESLRNENQVLTEQFKKDMAVLEHQLEKAKSTADTEKSKRIQQERDNQGTV